jgi:2-polyprenyl-6-hydroxyphenyl methylase/3-demethylubiquinone-9 3-methyltransferase
MEKKSSKMEKKSSKSVDKKKVTHNSIETLTPLTEETINKNEIHTFNQYEGNWWNEKGPLKPLHELNPIRLSFIVDQINRQKNLTNESHHSFQGLSILDIGCGAGLVAEPLARKGATVTGIDASDTALTQARLHAVEQNLDIQYERSTIEKKVEQGMKYDVVLALEVVEHVNNVPFFLKNCMDALNEDGIFFISTLNRTFLSYLKAIIAAEYVLKWIPVGTHNWNQFLKPSEIAADLQKQNFYFTNLKGINYNPLKKEWSLTNALDTNYIGCAIKR